MRIHCSKRLHVESNFQTWAISQYKYQHNRFGDCLRCQVKYFSLARQQKKIKDHLLFKDKPQFKEYLWYSDPELPTRPWTVKPFLLKIVELVISYQRFLCYKKVDNTDSLIDVADGYKWSVTVPFAIFDCFFKSTLVPFTMNAVRESLVRQAILVWKKIYRSTV